MFIAHNVMFTVDEKHPLKVFIQHRVHLLKHKAPANQ